MLRRGGIWTVRVHVPVDLRPLIGRREVWRSVRTTYRSEVRLRAAVFRGHKGARFVHLRRKHRQMSRQQLEALVGEPSCRSGVLPEEKTSATPESSCDFHCVIWFGCTSNRSASSARVASPLSAAKATFGLKAGEWLRRDLRVISASSSSRYLRLPEQSNPLIRLFSFSGPSQGATASAR